MLATSAFALTQDTVTSVSMQTGSGVTGQIGVDASMNPAI